MEQNLIEEAMETAIVEVSQESDTQARLPEKFRDPETGEVRLEALINSYLELERKLSGTMPRPDTEEGRLKVLRLLGMPETPEEYDITVKDGLFDIDLDTNKRLHAKGFTVEQVQEVYDLAAEKLVPAILELTQEFQADREVERLIAAFGGAEKWREVSRQLLAFGKQNLPEDVLENLSGSFEGVMALFRMMKSQEPGVSVRETTMENTGANEADLRSMMRDPRYWRQKDPAFVQKVTQGFERLYQQG